MVKNTKTILKPDIDSNLLASRQLQVILALDCSGSMRGDRIASLNYAIRSAIPAIQTVAEENPEVQVMIRAVCFNSVASWHIESCCPVNDLVWTDLTAGGETAMGAALTLISNALKPDVVIGRQLPPVIVLVSDGYPTDDISSSLKIFFSEKIARAATRLAIAIGNDSDIETLEKFMASPNNRLKPLRANNAPDLVQHIKWATTAAVRAFTLPSTNTDPVAQLASYQSESSDTDSEFVW